MLVLSRVEGFRIIVCLLLLCASSMVMAREVRLHGANSGGGECPDVVAAEPDAPRAIDNKRAPAATRSKATAPISFRGNDDTGARTPRWHRFLPGMFR